MAARKPQASAARAVVDAAGRADRKALATLARSGADLNASWRGYRPLHALIQEDPHAEGASAPAERLPALVWLLEHGADPNLPDERGWTALHQAASRGNERRMRALLAAGGDRARKDANGHTPLAIAVLARKARMVELFGLA